MMPHLTSRTALIRNLLRRHATHTNRKTPSLSGTPTSPSNPDWNVLVLMGAVPAVTVYLCSDDDASWAAQQEDSLWHVPHVPPSLQPQRLLFPRRLPVAACENANPAKIVHDGTRSIRIKKLYDIEQVLGQGTYGMVYRARRKSDGRIVALKTMAREYTGQTDFEREVAALQLLSKPPSHDHIVKLYDLHRDDKNYYLAMELVEGGELLDHLIEHGPYSEALAASFVRQFAEALCFIHSSGYIHADLKPENLMLSAKTKTDEENISLKLVDFGCARTHDVGRGDLQLPVHEFAAGCSFLHQVALGNQFELERILQERPNLVNFRDYDSRTSLHIAASEGHLDICRFLVGRGAQINRVDRWGGSPLDDAHRQGHSEVLEFLRTRGGKSGASKNIGSSSDQSSLASSDDLKGLVELGGKSGTMAYWAPELFPQDATPTPSADVWAAGVIVFILLTGTHPFDKNADATEEEIAASLTKLHNLTAKGDGSNLSFMDKIVFDERVEGLSESCLTLMKKLMHPDPKKRMTSENFRRHPWVQGLTASWQNMANGFDQLEAARWQRHFSEVLKLFASKHGIGDGKELSEQDLEAIFRALDVKQNGVLDLDEIASAFQQMDAHAESIRRAFECADLDGTGVIRWDEFRALMSEHFGNEDIQDNRPGLQARYLRNRFKNHILNRFDRAGDASSDEVKLREIFKAIDLEGNGVLDPHEIRVVLRSVGEPEGVISRIVASLDVNHDGGVDWSEFLDIMGRKA